MKATGLAIVALVAAGLAGAPFAAVAKKHRHVRHFVSTTTGSNGYVTPGTLTTGSATYGSSGHPIGTVTAPSVGSYYWPSVGVTNAVPTWSNTTPK